MIGKTTTTELTFDQESFSDLVAAKEKTLRVTNRVFVAFACVGLAALVIRGVLAASSATSGVSVVGWLMFVGAIILGALPGVATIFSGHLLPELLVKAVVPAHLKSSSGDAGETEDDGQVLNWVVFSLCGLVYFGSAVMSLSHMVGLAETVGLAEPLFWGLNSAVLIPCSVELMQLAALAASIRIKRDLAKLRAQASEVLGVELAHQLDHQRQMIKIETERLAGQAELAAAQITNREQRAVLAEKLKISRKYAVLDAREAAETDRRLNQLERGAKEQVREATIKAQIEMGMQQAELEIEASKQLFTQQLAALERGEITDLTVGGLGKDVTLGEPKLNGSHGNGNHRNGTVGSGLQGIEL